MRKTLWEWIYYTVEYKKKKKLFSTVKRTTQSLFVVMRKDEEEGPVIDPILYLNEEDLAFASKKQKVIVKLAENESAIQSLVNIFVKCLQVFIF